MRRLLPALLAGMLFLAGCSSSEADAASVTSAETSYSVRVSTAWEWGARSE